MSGHISIALWPVKRAKHQTVACQDDAFTLHLWNADGTRCVRHDTYLKQVGALDQDELLRSLHLSAPSQRQAVTLQACRESANSKRDFSYFRSAVVHNRAYLTCAHSKPAGDEGHPQARASAASEAISKVSTCCFGCRLLARLSWREVPPPSLCTATFGV